MPLPESNESFEDLAIRAQDLKFDAEELAWKEKCEWHMERVE